MIFSHLMLELAISEGFKMFKKIVGYLLFVLVTLNASNIESEVGFNVGLDSTRNEDGNKFENPSFGLVYQNNKYIVAPRLDLEYVNVTKDKADGLWKFSANGLYEYENRTYITPYALAGLGYEYVVGSTKNVFESHPFVQGGVGVILDVTRDLKVNFEGKILKVVGGTNEGNEVMLTVGMRMPLRSLFGKRPSPKRVIQPVRPIPVPQPILPIIPRVAIPPRRTPPPRVMVIENSNNECSIKIAQPDFDRDGVSDSLDQCPATPCNFTVDRYGCPIKTRLKVNFSTNSAEIEPASYYRVEQFAQFLLKNRGSRVKIFGYTDNRGTARHNLLLSQQRANAIMKALVTQGVSLARIEAMGRGESMPIASNTTEEGRARNRRIEAELSYPKGGI